MNKKAFIKWQIKNFLPFFAILLAIVSSSFFSFAFATNVAYMPYNDPSIVGGDSNNSGIIARVFSLLTDGSGLSASFFSFSMVGFLYATVIPFVVYYYRYNKKAADAYGQFSAKRGEIIRIRVLIAQAMGLIVLATIFVLGTLIMLLRQVVYNSVKGENFYFEYGYFFLFLLVYLFTWSVVYYFNCFACSRAHCLKNAVITVACFQAVVSLLLVGLYTYSSAFNAFYSQNTSADWLITFTPYLPTFYFAAIFSRLSYNGTLGDISVLGSYQAVISLAGSLIFAILSAIGVFLDKEPSGETYGISQPRSDKDKIALHLGATTFAFFISVIAPGIGSILGFFLIMMAVLMYGGVYLLLLFIYYKTLHLKKMDWILYAANLALTLLLSLIIFFHIQSELGVLHV